METELDILQLADYSERFTEGEASAYLIINKNITTHPCMFGFEKLPEDFEAVKKLFEKIESKAKELGYSEIIGPLNHNTWMNYRWATDNYDQVLFPDCTNPPYYVDYIKRLGYDTLYTYRSAMIKIHNPLYEIGAATLAEKENEGFTFKRYDGTECLPILHDLFDITRDAFLGTELYSDIPYEYFEKLYAAKILKIEVLVIFVAYDQDQKAIGYVLGYPNPDKSIFVAKSSAVMKEYQNNKVYIALLYLGLKYMEDLGYSETLFHFQCEQRKTFRRFPAEYESKEKHYAVFKKEL